MPGIARIRANITLGQETPEERGILREYENERNGDRHALYVREAEWATWKEARKASGAPTMSGWIRGRVWAGMEASDTAVVQSLKDQVASLRADKETLQGLLEQYLSTIGLRGQQVKNIHGEVRELVRLMEARLAD